MNSAVEVLSTQEPGLRISRIFDAAREVVWKALTDPNQVSHWYGGDGFTSPVCEMDVRPGGLWRHVMRAPNGQEFPMNNIFLEVEAPALLVWKNTGARRPGGPPDIVSTVTLEDLNGKTRWTLNASFVSTDDRDTADNMGFTRTVSQSADRMAAYLATL